MAGFWFLFFDKEINIENTSGSLSFYEGKI
jgi:hypothetical protein